MVTNSYRIAKKSIIVNFWKTDDYVFLTDNVVEKYFLRWKVESVFEPNKSNIKYSARKCLLIIQIAICETKTSP